MIGSERVTGEDLTAASSGGTTSVDLYAFGSRAGPRPPRKGIDLIEVVPGQVGPEGPPFPNGASSFADPQLAPLSGHYHRLPRGTPLPEGIQVVADGRDVHANSPHEPSHHTIYPAKAMTPQQFIDLFLGLPWQYAGNKK
jgi:hypothetical protein